MRDLWKGLAMIALDVELRNGVAAVAKFEDRPEYEVGLRCHPKVEALHLRNQPNVAALRAIDALYRTRGLYLGTYALAEVNRWFLDGKEAFIEALDAFAAAIQRSVAVALPVQNPGFLEAVGVLVADPEFKDMFGKSEKNLRDFGFIISKVEEDALRVDFAPSSAADIQSDKIFKLGWSGSSCEGRLLPYEGMFHTNM